MSWTAFEGIYNLVASRTKKVDKRVPILYKAHQVRGCRRPEGSSKRGRSQGVDKGLGPR